MMQEIFQRGPIACSIASTSQLHDYSGGIFKDSTGSSTPNHEVSVVGWGEENGQKYWRVRNSWGTFWGEDGFFRVVRGENNIGIEEDCVWAEPRNTWEGKFSTERVSKQEELEHDYKHVGETGNKIVKFLPCASHDDVPAE